MDSHSNSYEEFCDDPSGKVHLYSSDGKRISTFPSFEDAARHFGLEEMSIRKFYIFGILFLADGRKIVRWHLRFLAEETK